LNSNLGILNNINNNDKKLATTEIRSKKKDIIILGNNDNCRKTDVSCIDKKLSEFEG